MKPMPISRIEFARAYAREQIERDPDIVGAILTGSAARGDGVELSDVDIRLLLGESVGDDSEREDVQTWRGGLFLDVEYDSIARYSDPTELLKQPYWAAVIHDAVILFDRDGVLADVQRVVVDQFMRPKWLAQRLSSLIAVIERNHKEFVVAVDARNEVEVCRASIFMLWTICDVLLVRHGTSPSWVRGLQKLGEVLPRERDRIVSIEGSSAKSPGEVSSFIPLFEQNIGTSAGVMGHVLKEIEWMIRNDLHREAFHSLWAGVGLALKGHMSSGEAKKQRRARSQAHSWLTKANWRGDELRAKASQLGEYMSHVLQLVRVIG